MQSASLFTALVALFITAVRAIQVTAPNQQSVWTVGGTGTTVTWTSVSTDPEIVDVYLVNFSRYPNSVVRLKADVPVSAGSLSIDSNFLEQGTGWQINLVPRGSNSQQILAQSNLFTILAAGSAGGQAQATATAGGTRTATAAVVAPIVTNGNTTAAGMPSVPRVSSVSGAMDVTVPMLAVGCVSFLCLLF